jgi:Zn-finger nucleic acid-binding protein
LQKQARKERRYSVGHSYIKGTCPRCSGMLSVSYEGGVQLERCLVCNGLFFDYGELDACLKMEADNWFQRIVKRIFGA